MRAPRGNPVTKTLATQFEFTYNVFKLNTTDIDQAISLKQPRPAGNCINWIGGHLVATRCGLLELLGGEPVWNAEKRERYRRGTSPITSDDDATPWEEIAASFDASQGRLRVALQSLTLEQLLSPLAEDKNPFKVETLAEMIGTLAFHESYHVGQLGVLRRLVGLDGMIR
jgi:hypothetical protein